VEDVRVEELEHDDMREDALDGVVAMLDRAWAVPTPEREPETVTSAGGPKRAVGKRLGC